MREYRHFLPDWVRTRVSPRSARLRSFSCRLLVDSLSGALSFRVAGADLPKNMGDITDVQSLKTA